MLKWLKSSPSDAAATGPKIRPPWIQKIRIDEPVRNTTSSETEWQSRLAVKLQAMREVEAPPKPTHVAGQSEDENFAFHLTPLDTQTPAGERRQITPERPAFREENEPPRPARSEERFAGALDYQPRQQVQILVTTGVYELTHSTADYGGGDEFDLERLFEDQTRPAPGAWSAPAEAIEALMREPSPAVSDLEFPADFESTIEPESIPEAPVKKAEVIQKPLVAAVPKKTAEKPAIALAPTPAVDRASVTPVLQINKQRELLFPLLKTQKRALEFANPAEAQSVIEKLEETLEQFSIDGHVVGIQRGPIITRYELKMAAGIKVNRILALTDELAMALEAMRVRIEAPIPGRSTVGIEIPNKQRVKVLLGDVLNDAGYREFGGQLPLPLGRDIAGNLLLEDLTRMPHLLIAGATGSGKSVAVNSFISSLIMHKTPEEVRFLLVDPKLVELSAYNDIPHLLHPVITEPHKAILALNWTVEEMERRYEDLADMRARDIRSFNEKVRANKEKSDYPIMPYIVVLIDELGDLMMVAGKEVESSIIRLAQKARAVGIHLILATQRPSVDVITALIKANCPARIALQVAQKTDSRTILDGNGAEQLLGQGDMLFRHPSKAQLIRAQVPLIEDNEVEDVVSYAKKLAKPIYITLEDPKGKMGELEDGDEELFDEAWQIIVESQKASASYLQRRLRIGYNKAARLIEAFEARGMIGPQIGSKPREIIGTGQGGISHVP
ncbi:MAG: DNA translocase FtsK [Turneriella sp.]|nr:DNA translocase FtsK [Turneriella sp.]